jgi:tetratricopeptide (TPR) repeat protein
MNSNSRFKNIMPILMVAGMLGLAFQFAGSPLWALVKKNPKQKEEAPATPSDDKSKQGNKSEAYFHFSMGRMLEESGDSLKALDEFKKALQLDPQSSSLRLEMANVHLRKRNLRAALQEAEAAVRLDNANIEAHRLLATIYLAILKNEDPNRNSSAGDYLKKSIQEYETIVKLDTSDSEALLNLSGLYREDGQTEKAIGTLQKYLAQVPSSEAGLSYLSQIYAEQGKFEDALSALKKALEGNPNSPAILAQLAFTYEQAKDFKNAVVYYRLAIAADEDSLNLRKGLAQVLIDNGQEDEAEKEYLKIVEADPDEGVAFLRLGQIYRDRGESEKALENFNKANAILVGNYEVAFNIALLYEQTGKYEKAEEGFKQLLKLTEKTSGTYSVPEKQNRTVFLYHAGLVAQQLEKYTQAIEFFSQIKSLNPDGDNRADLNIIDTFRMARQLDKSLDLCDASIKASPGESDFKILRAELLAESGKVQQALQELQNLLTKSTEDARVYTAMVSILQKEKKYQEAQKILEGCKEYFKNKEQYSFLLGANYERMKEWKKAEDTFLEILQTDPKNVACANYLGYMWADQNTKLDEALELLKKAVKQDPNNGAYLDSLGWVYFRLNQFDQAELYLKKALERVRKDPTIHEHLGDLYLQKGQLEKSLTAYEQAIFHNQDEEETRKVQKKLDDLKIRIAAMNRTK